MPALDTSPPSPSRKVRESWNERRERASALLSDSNPLPSFPLSLPPSPFSQAAASAAARPLTAAAVAAVAAAPTLSADASSLSAFGLLPQELIVYPPGSLSRVAGVDREGVLWVELLLDENENENENDEADEAATDEESNGLSLRSALSPTALRPGDAIIKAPEPVRIDFEARRSRKDQKLQQQKRATEAAAAAAAAAAVASKAEQAKKQ